MADSKTSLPSVSSKSSELTPAVDFEKVVLRNPRKGEMFTFTPSLAEPDKNDSEVLGASGKPSEDLKETQEPRPWVPCKAKDLIGFLVIRIAPTKTCRREGLNTVAIVRDVSPFGHILLEDPNSNVLYVREPEFNDVKWARVPNDWFVKRVSWQRKNPDQNE
jgi:hypothetical protein